MGSDRTRPSQKNAKSRGKMFQPTTFHSVQLLMKIYVLLNGEIVGKGKTIPACLKYVTKLFNENPPDADIRLSGGFIASWRKNV
jgi:hypothetical protein